MLLLLRIGQPVLVCDNIPGTIAAITIRGVEGNQMVSYEVVWWDGAQRREEWMPPHEFRLAEPKLGTMKIGFTHGNAGQPEDRTRASD